MRKEKEFTTHKVRTNKELKEDNFVCYNCRIGAQKGKEKHHCHSQRCVCVSCHGTEVVPSLDEPWNKPREVDYREGNTFVAGRKVITNPFV